MMEVTPPTTCDHRAPSLVSRWMTGVRGAGDGDGARVAIEDLRLVIEVPCLENCNGLTRPLVKAGGAGAAEAASTVAETQRMSP